MMLEHFLPQNRFTLLREMPQAISEAGGNTGWLGKWPGFMMLEHFLPQNRFTLLREML